MQNRVQVEMIAHFPLKSKPKPLKFRIKDARGDAVTVKINRIYTTDENKYAGNLMLVYKVEAVVNDTLRLFELRLEKDTMTWWLYP